MAFDAMHAVTGPYAIEILENRLGAPKGTVLNGTPLPDFGGHHPDPNLVHAKALYDEMMGADAPDFGAASDGDGDRNLIIGRGIFVTPSDSLAVLAANAHARARLRERPRGHRALDADERRGGPGGGEARRRPLRDPDRAGSSSATCSTPASPRSAARRAPAPARITCARRTASGRCCSGSTSSRRARRARRRSCEAHWREYGRNYYSRHDYEGLDVAAANALVDAVRDRLPGLPGTKLGKLKVAAADDFAYLDPVDGSTSRRQGLRVLFEGGSRVVFRLSGTGTSGATLRVYIERFEADPKKHGLETQAALAELIAAAEELAGIRARTRRDAPDVVT